MTRLRGAFAAAAVLTGVILGCAACDNDAAPSGANPGTELDNIQTTLDAIDSEVAGDDSP